MLSGNAQGKFSTVLAAPARASASAYREDWRKRSSDAFIRDEKSSLHYLVRGSRHGTPFDSVEVTNASLLALLTDQPLPPRARWVRDTPASAQALSLAGSIAEEHATARLFKSVDRLAPV